MHHSCPLCGRNRPLREDQFFTPARERLRAPFALGPNDGTSRSIEVRLTGSAPLVLRCLDAKSKQPIIGLAVRLRDADGTPIVHGHGSGNFFERTSDDGEVIYNQLRPGDYTVQVLGKQAQVNDFVQYEPMKEWMPVHVEAAGPTNAEILVPPRAIDAEEIEQRFPFYVYGLVTDEQGNPLAGVEVHAATGMGTLLGGGRTRTDAGGRYRLLFGPGVGTRINKELAPLGVGLQAALISARHEGRFETNFNRQGDFCMSDRTPERLEQEIEEKGQIWGKASLDRFVLPGRPREVNFSLAPAATLRGTLSWESHELDDKQLYLTGDELPPGCNVLTTLTTDQKGEFELDSVPIGKPWRFGMRIEGTFYKIETEPFTLDNPGTHRCELMLDAKPTNDGAVTLRLRYRDLGLNQALVERRFKAKRRARHEPGDGCRLVFGAGCGVGMVGVPSGLGVAADRSIRTPASGQRVNNATGGRFAGASTAAPRRSAGTSTGARPVAAPCG